MPLLDENKARGLPVKSKFQQGISNADNTGIVEDGVQLPAMADPVASYMYFDCTVGVMLDSGMVVHNRLPQVNNTPDSLASAFLDDINLDTIAGPGVNLRCHDQYQDIIQRMGHARYWFRLWGQALRFNYRVPIPALKMVGGVPVVPYDQNPQWAFNRIFPGGNYSGVILWHAVWSLWYTTLVPPTSNNIPEVDLSAHISGVVSSIAAGAINSAVSSIPAPLSVADGNAASVIPPISKGAVTGAAGSNTINPKIVR